MAWTWKQRVDRAIAHYVDNGVIDEDRVSTVKRPPFFDAYKFSIGFWPSVEHWYRWDEYLEQVSKIIEPFDAKLHHNRKTLSFWIFGNDPALLKEIYKIREPMVFGFIHVVDESCWDRKLRKADKRARYKFYHQFNYRVRFSPEWTNASKIVEGDLYRFKGKGLQSPTRSNLYYIEELNDIMLIKILYSEQISEIEDRSHLPK
jgi:hypothetical protein